MTKRFWKKYDKSTSDLSGMTMSVIEVMRRFWKKCDNSTSDSPEWKRASTSWHVPWGQSGLYLQSPLVGHVESCVSGTNRQALSPRPAGPPQFSGELTILQVIYTKTADPTTVFRPVGVYTKVTCTTPTFRQVGILATPAEWYGLTGVYYVPTRGKDAHERFGPFEDVDQAMMFVQFHGGGHAE